MHEGWWAPTYAATAPGLRDTRINLPWVAGKYGIVLLNVAMVLCCWIADLGAAMHTDGGTTARKARAGRGSVFPSLEHLHAIAGCACCLSHFDHMYQYCPNWMTGTLAAKPS
jgi:hypothetical protein